MELQRQSLRMGGVLAGSQREDTKAALAQKRLVPEPQERLMFHLSSFSGRVARTAQSVRETIFCLRVGARRKVVSLSLASAAGMFFMQQCISSSRHMSQLLLAATVAC